MPRSYRDAVVIVTGAGSGIGRALALALGGAGARLALVGRRAEALAQTAGLAGGGLVAPCDVTDEDAVSALCDRVVGELGEPDVLVNNAGRGAYGRFDRVEVAEHRAVIATNLVGVVHMTHRVLPRMLARRQGQLVFVSSVLGELPAPEHAVYGATKFAVTGFAESLSYELRGTGISVTVVEPGLVRSGFQAVSGTPLARFGQLPSQTSTEAADRVLAAMSRERRLHVADRWAGLAIRLRRHLPRLLRLLYRVGYERARRRA